MKFALVSLALMALVGTACAQLTPCLEGCIATAEAEAGCSGYARISCPPSELYPLPLLLLFLLRSCHPSRPTAAYRTDSTGRRRLFLAG